MSFLLFYLFLACIMAGAYQWYCHHREDTENLELAKAAILRDYEPEIFEPLSLTPILTTGDRVLIRGQLTIAVSPYHPRYEACSSLIPIAHEAIALWALSLTKSDDGQRPDSYRTLKQTLTGLECSIARITDTHITTIVALKKTQSTVSPVEEVQGSVALLQQLDAYREIHKHDLFICQLIDRRREAIIANLLDPVAP